MTSTTVASMVLGLIVGLVIGFVALWLDRRRRR